MKLKDSYTLFSLYMIIYGLFSTPALLAENTDYIKLLNNVIQHQPERQIFQGIEEQHSASQALSNSFIPGDIDLIVHHENDAITDNDAYQNWQVGVEFPVWLASQKNAQKLMTSSYAQEMTGQQIYLKWLASNTLRQLVWNYRNARIELDAAHSSLQKSLSIQQKVRQKVKAGESPQLDLLLAKKAVLTQQDLLVQKQSALTIAQIQFQKWTQSEQPPKKIEEKTRTVVAMDQHPKIIKLMSELQISESELQKLKSLKRESPRLFLGAQNNKDKNSENTSLLFEISIPLGMDSSYLSKMAEQKRTIYEKQALLDREKLELEEKILQARQALAAAKQSIHFSKKQYNLNQQALIMSEQAYQLGETNIQNLLLVQQHTEEAKLKFELAQARSGWATAMLNQVSGHILGE